MASQRLVPVPELDRRLAWRLAGTIALLLVLGSAAGVGIGYVLAQGIEALLSGIV